jgi:HEAT repeat protein
LAALNGTKEHASSFEQARAALGDPEPFVRAAAASVLSRLGNRSAIQELIKLVDDKALARCTLEARSLIETDPVQLVYTVPGRPHVSESALSALSELSGGELSYTLGGRNDSEESWNESIRAAKAWYQRVGDGTPHEP